jgi:simple sugar transport system ATP-binding protein
VPAGLFGPAGRRRLGLASVPEERLGHSAVPDMTLAENVLLTDSPARPLTRSGFIDRGRAARFAEEIVARFDVRTAGVDHAARSLSGGNLQKFVVGREIVKQPAVLVVSQPTWGVDAGAAAAIHVALLGLAEAGAAVLVISQDLDELLAIADRIAVIAGGRLAPAHPIDGLTAEALGLEMGGSTVSDSAAEGEGEAAAHA